MRPRQVVGAAVVDTAGSRPRVLAAQRSHPPDVAGRWELPGGKVEPGETPERAVRRELAEELGLEVEVIGWLTGRETVRAGLVLRVAVARVVSGEPVAHEHAALRWLGAGELDEVDWLDSDRPFVAQLPGLLAAVVPPRAPGVPRPSRAVFGEEADARAVAAALVADGFEAVVAREPFAGEDDDEDHAWAVRTDAPEAALDLLCETHDGWLDAAEPAHRRPPLDLPAAPKRHHRPPQG